MSKKRKHTTLVPSYLRPKSYALVVGYSELNEMSRSEVMNMAVRCFFDTVPNDIKEKIIKFDKNNY
jgi:hypothetical protein